MSTGDSRLISRTHMNHVHAYSIQGVNMSPAELKWRARVSFVHFGISPRNG